MVMSVESMFSLFFVCGHFECFNDVFPLLPSDFWLRLFLLSEREGV